MATTRPAAGGERLLGELAVRLGFITGDDLAGATDARRRGDGRPLGEILSDRGAVRPEDRALLELLAGRLAERRGDGCAGEGARILQAATEPDAKSNGDRGRSVDDTSGPSTLDRVDTGDGAEPPRARSAGAPGDRFRILRLHNQGGLGEIFVAHDLELDREVAYKQIRPEHAHQADSRSRFLLEAEITGGLEHPGIVPVYGLGTDAGGRPYYAMRLVRGETLKAAIRRFHEGPAGSDDGARTLELRRLLRRFLDACNAIEYAHSRGVLHRDIKPGNILVGPYGETLVVDWGLARVSGRDEPTTPEPVLRPPSSHGPSATLPGTPIGTPGYMSPEQAEGRHDRVGPASDVYSLGATLHCLLTGRAPSPDGGATGPPLALMAICEKAMDRAPERRYPGPRALAVDVERWLADEPVSVWREPAAARLRRWMRRYRPFVTGVAAAMVAGLIGLGAIAVVLQQANTRLRRANLATNAAKEEVEAALARTLAAQKATRAALAESDVEWKKNANLINFLVEVFSSPDPARDGRSIRVVEVLDRTAADLERTSSGLPEHRGGMFGVLGKTYLGLGLYDRALELLTKADALLEASLGRGTYNAIRSRSDVGAAYYQLNRTADAIAALEDALRRAEAVLGDRDPDTLQIRNNLANAYAKAGRTDEAIGLLRRTLVACREVLGPDRKLTLMVRNSLAAAYLQSGRWVEAGPLLEAAVPRFADMYGPDHAETLTVRNNLARYYRLAGRTDEAIAMHRLILARREAKLGFAHPLTVSSRNNIAAICESTGRWADAEPMRRDNLAAVRSLEKPGPRDLDNALAFQGLDLIEMSRWSEAEGVLRECLAIREKIVPDDWTRFNTMSKLGEAVMRQGRHGEAEPLVVGGYEGMRARSARMSTRAGRRLSESLDRAIRLYDAWGRPADVERWRRTFGQFLDRGFPDRPFAD